MSTTFGSPRVMGSLVQLRQVIINLPVYSFQSITQSGQPMPRIDIEAVAR